MEIAELIRLYIETILTWPTAAMVLGVLGMRRFQDPIGKFLGRLTKGEAYGVRLEAANPSEQRKEIKEVQAKALGEAGATSGDASSSEYQLAPSNAIEWVRDNPEATVLEYRRMANSQWFERAYNLIYGSQIRLLEYLTQYGDKGVPYVNLAPFYDDFVKQSNLSTTQMAEYVGFLHDAKFVVYDGVEPNINVRITPFGLDFLSYIKGQYALGYASRVY